MTATCTRMKNMPAAVVSTTLEDPVDWPDATLVSGDAVDVVARLKEDRIQELVYRPNLHS